MIDLSGFERGQAFCIETPVGFVPSDHRVTEPAKVLVFLLVRLGGRELRRGQNRQADRHDQVVHRDHFRTAASLGFRLVEGALRTIEGYEAMHLIRKGQIRWLPKGDVIGQRQFIHTLFGVAAELSDSSYPTENLIPSFYLQQILYPSPVPSVWPATLPEVAIAIIYVKFGRANES